MAIEPLKLKGLERAVDKTTAASPSAADPHEAPSDAWIAEHPTFEEPVAEQPAVVTDPPQTETAERPVTETPETPATEPPDVTETPAPEAKPAAEPAQAVDKKPEDKPTATPKAFASEEKFALADGNEWTRAQIIEGLQRAQQYEPLAAEAQGFQKLFASSYEQAQKNWGPLLERLHKEPTTLDFIDSYLGNREKAAYLEQCSQYFDQQKTTEPSEPAQATAKLPPEQQKQLDELKAFKDRVEREAAIDRVNREMAQATEKYPFLATDANLRNDLLMTAQALNAQDPTKGIVDALKLKASIYDAMSIARTQQATQPEVPAMPTASGATPTTTASPTIKPKKFNDTTDAVEDWINNPPPQFRG